MMSRDGRGLDREPGSSAIEIDDVDPVRAGPGERVDHRDRVVAVHRLAGEVPLDEPNHPSAAQVDRRQELEWPLGPSLERGLDVCHPGIVAF